MEMPRRNFTTSIDEDLLEKIKIEAVKERRNVNDIFEQLIREYLKQKRQKKNR
jgi:metal-responsive CopG/Arc/MetJ family transcriptional regulator